MAQPPPEPASHRPCWTRGRGGARIGESSRERRSEGGSAVSWNKGPAAPGSWNKDGVKLRTHDESNFLLSRYFFWRDA